MGKKKKQGHQQSSIAAGGVASGASSDHHLIADAGLRHGEAEADEGDLLAGGDLHSGSEDTPHAPGDGGGAGLLGTEGHSGPLSGGAEIESGGPVKHGGSVGDEKDVPQGGEIGSDVHGSGSMDGCESQAGLPHDGEPRTSHADELLGPDSSVARAASLPSISEDVGASATVSDEGKVHGTTVIAEVGGDFRPAITETPRPSSSVETEQGQGSAEVTLPAEPRADRVVIGEHPVTGAPVYLDEQ